MLGFISSILGMDFPGVGTILTGLNCKFLRPVFENPLSSLATISWVSLIGCFMFVPFVIIEAPWDRVWSNEEWFLIAYLGVLSTALCYVFFAMGIETIGANKAASFINVVPIFGILSSWLWIDEELGYVQLFSFILIYFGVKLVNQQPTETVARN